MFTGLVTDIGDVVSVAIQGKLRRIRVACNFPVNSIAIGASIACSGPCMTAVCTGEAGGRTWFEFDAGAETLALTNAGQWRAGRRINLERSLKIGDELGGHMVSGHVDGLALIMDRHDFDGMARFELAVPPEFARFIAQKGSVSLDGTSLTVNSVAGNAFSILLIPHTLAVTTWGERKVGDQVNLEVDVMARYAARLAEASQLSPIETSPLSSL